jgi:CRP-like cAMP-binding protein
MEVEMNETQALVDQYIDENKTDDALNLLCKTAIDLARNQRFDEAETCRDRLYEVDSTALSAIIKVNEVIENEKSRAISTDFRQTWAHILEPLTAEEAYALNSALKSVHLPPDHAVIEQGRANNRLFFVNSGRLKMLCRIGDKDILLKNMGMGAIFGQETFFSINVCTHTITTLSRAELSCLEKKRLVALQAKFPHLYSNLEKILCNQGRRTAHDCLSSNGIERRNHKRYRLSVRIRARLLTPNADKTTGPPINGEMWDISKCGLSFYYKSKDEKSVQRLLGRTLCVRFSLKGGSCTRPIVVTGTVRGLQKYPMDKYSVHLRLNRSFSDAAVKTISKIAL